MSVVTITHGGGMKSTTGFPVIEGERPYRVVQVRDGAGKEIRKRFSFCNLATPGQNDEGFYGLVEYHTGYLAQCRTAAEHASRFGGAFAVEGAYDRVAVAEFEDGAEV